MAAKKTNKKENKSVKVGDAGILINPTPGHILIEPIEAEGKTTSGIYLPDTADKKTQKGRILAIGGDEITDSGVVKKAPAKIGQLVIYKKWGGSEVQLGTKEYLFAKFEDILAVEG